ncbi:MAG: DUF3368 domain-containing protein [Cyanobacteria bacterium J06626_26]
MAERFGIRRIGTLGILRRAKKSGFISVIKPSIEKLCANGIYIQAKLIEVILEDVGEI